MREKGVLLLREFMQNFDARFLISNAVRETSEFQMFASEMLCGGEIDRSVFVENVADLYFTVNSLNFLYGISAEELDNVLEAKLENSLRLMRENAAREKAALEKTAQESSAPAGNDSDDPASVNPVPESVKEMPAVEGKEETVVPVLEEVPMRMPVASMEKKDVAETVVTPDSSDKKDAEEKPQAPQRFSYREYMASKGLAGDPPASE